MTTATTENLAPIRDALAFQHAKQFDPDDAARMVLRAELGTRVLDALTAEPARSWAVFHVPQSATEPGVRPCDSYLHAAAVRDGLLDHYLPAQAAEYRDGTWVPVGPVRHQQLLVALERLRAEHEDGDVDRDGVIDRLRDWRPDLSADELWALWEDIDTALERLEHVGGDMFCPSEGDRLQLDQEWAAALQAALDRVKGTRR